jgi:hypothetical protein
MSASWWIVAKLSLRREAAQGRSRSEGNAVRAHERRVGRLEMGTKTPPPERLDFGGGDRLVVALVGISAVAIQR